MPTAESPFDAPDDHLLQFNDCRLEETSAAAQAIALVVDALPDDAVPDLSELRP